jgi:hypothetical protein
VRAKNRCIKQLCRFLEQRLFTEIHTVRIQDGLGTFADADGARKMVPPILVTLV